MERPADESGTAGDGGRQPQRQSLWGLVSQKERWGRSAFGRFALFLLGIGVMGAVVGGVHPFLVVRQRMAADVVVVEGWVHEHAHARRTRFLFKKAPGRDLRVGVSAVRSRDCDPARWWWYSEEVSEASSETMAYLCTGLLFHPVAPGSSPPVPITRTRNTVGDEVTSLIPGRAASPRLLPLVP